MASTVGRYIKFLQSTRYSSWREESLPNHSGKASILPNLSRNKNLREMKYWILSGRELRLAHPHKCSFWRDMCEHWMEMEQGKASNSSQTSPIIKDFKRVRQSNSNPSGKSFNFPHFKIVNLTRECDSRRSRMDTRFGHSEISNCLRECNSRTFKIDIKLRHFQIFNWVRECPSPKSGIDFRLGHFPMSKYWRDLQNCNPFAVLQQHTPKTPRLLSRYYIKIVIF